MNDIVGYANNVLQNLRNNAEPTPTALAFISKNDDELGKHQATVATAVFKAKLHQEYGAIRYGPKDAIVNLGMNLQPSEIDRVIDVLKATNRIIQIGTGNGKATVILAHNMISSGEYVEKSIIASDAIGLSKALKDAVSSLVQDNKALTERLTTAQKQAYDAEIEKNKALSALNSKARTTWT